MSSGGGGGTQRTVATPWSGIQNYLSGGGGHVGIYPEAENLYRRNLPIVRGFTPNQRQGMRDLVGYANNFDTQFSPYQQGMMQGMSDDMLYADSNPYLQSYMDAATRPIEQQYDFSIAPQNRAESTAAGNYGSRAGIAEGVAQGLRDQAIVDTRGRIASQAYNQGLENRIRTAALYPQMLQAGQMPANTLLDVGSMQQHQDERLYAEPYERFNRYASVIQPGAGIGGSTAVSGGYSGPSRAANALAGAQIGSQIGGQLFQNNPTGQWIMTGLGGLLGGGG